jgi:hypothetical protein
MLSITNVNTMYNIQEKIKNVDGSAINITQLSKLWCVDAEPSTYE